MDFTFLRRPAAARGRPGKHSEPERMPSVCPAAYTEEESRFLQAVDAYRRLNDVSTPRVTELLWILRRLGYRQVLPPGKEAR